MSITTHGWGGGSAIGSYGWGAARRVELVLWLSADYLGKRADPSTQREKPDVVSFRRKPDEIPARSAGAGEDETE